MSIIKATFDKMLKKIPAKKSNEEIYQDVNWTFSIVYYIEELMLRLELRDERIKRYVNADLISESEEIERAKFKKKFQILVRELLDIKKDITIENYVKYYVASQSSLKRYHFHKSGGRKVHTMSASIKRVKQIPEGAICL